MNETVVIVNPASALGKTGNQLKRLKGLLQQHLGEHELYETKARGDATRLARQAADSGAARVISAGGDGTASEIVGGLIQSDRGRDVHLGLLPLGTGGDFSRMVWGKRDMDAALRRIAGGKTRRVDAARVKYSDRDGQSQTGAFLNILSCGMSAFTCLWIEKQALRGKRGRLTYLLGGILGTLRYRQPSVTISVDGELVHEGPLALAAFANGRYFGGGMKVAPDAKLDDGLLEVVIVPGGPRWKLLVQSPKILTGAHVRSDDVISLRGRKVSVTGSVWLEADGEPIGRAPAEIEVVPNAIQLCDG